MRGKRAAIIAVAAAVALFTGGTAARCAAMVAAGDGAAGQQENAQERGEDGRGLPIQMTMVQYLDRYVYDTDYTQAPEIGIDRIITSGNALENLSEAYPDCRFVDFSFPSADPVNDGLDWSSLKLVFYPEASRWYLVGIVHGEWTI